eukprot:10059967-Heterocapsa_arctica.AAC.1
MSFDASSSMSPPLLLHTSGHGRRQVVIRFPPHVDVVALMLVPKLFMALLVVGFPLGHFVFQGFQ